MLSIQSAHPQRATEWFLYHKGNLVVIVVVSKMEERRPPTWLANRVAQTSWSWTRSNWTIYDRIKLKYAAFQTTRHRQVRALRYIPRSHIAILKMPSHKRSAKIPKRSVAARMDPDPAISRYSIERITVFFISPYKREGSRAKRDKLRK